MMNLFLMKVLIYGWIFVFIYGNTLFSNEFVETDGSILLPQQKFFKHAADQPLQITLTLSDFWQSFKNDHGNWAVQWNEYTGTPHRAFGKSVPITGYSQISDENIESASLSFINEFASVLKVNSADLKLVRANKINRKWYVTYKQVKENIDVLFSEVELRIFDNGKVMSFGSDFYNDIEISLEPSIGLEEAKSNAIKYLEFTSGIDKVHGSGKLYILPLKKDKMIFHHLVYHIEVSISNPVGNFDVFVDAHNGEIIWRHNRIRFTDTKAHVSGDVQLVLPTDPFIEKDLIDQFVNFGGSTLITDSIGLVVKNITSSENLSTELRGPWVNVNRQDAGDASFSNTINPGDSINIIWDINNSHAAERDAFYHVNVIHNFITDLDPSFTYLNYSMPCAVNINSTCNAYWDGTGINFYAAGGGCPNTGQMPSVIYHEYGHGINDKLYEQAGSYFGMINGATHEGLADVSAALIEDDPRVGRGFFGAGTVLRNLINTNRYPDDISGEVHYD
jgi:Zn-dependent metalloprotease